MSVAPARTQSRAVRRRSLSLLSIVLVAATPALVGTSAGHAVTCLSAGTDSTIQAALSGAGAQAVLCPGAVFALSNTVHFTAPNQAILTQGLPGDNTRAVLRIAASGLTGAINGGGQSGVTVDSVEVDGNIGTYGRLGGDALLEMGNQGSNQTIQNSFLHDTRSWSTLHLMEGAVTNDVPQCQNARVVNNLVMSAGTNVPSGTWADGISLACGTSLVQGNTVIDATDGSIVIFGAPGSTVQNNTIIAQSRVMLGGINLVDYDPVHGNYTGTKVLNNTIDARGALIKVGVASGPGTWFCEPDTTVNHGATIQGNTLQGTHMGYGFAVRGVSQWTITGNTDNSTHAGVAGSMCGGGTQNPQAPGRFQYYAPATSATLQPEFQAVTGNYWGLLNITENVGSAPLVYAARSSLSYAPVAVGASSSPQTVTITNTGPATATVSGVSVTGDYSQTNNCASLPTGSSCVVSVTFRPTANGTRTGTLSVASNAGNGTATVALTGSTGTAGGSATLAASPSSLAFSATPVNGASGTQTVTVSNSGTAAAALSSVTTSGDFTQTNTCGTSVAAGSSCTVTATFRPVAAGTRSGSLTVSSNATNPTLTVALSGTGTSSGSTNLSIGAAMSANSTQQTYGASNANDGNPSTYWEGANAYPQWLQVDLGTVKSVTSLTVTVPPASTWATRTQTFTVTGSADGSTFTTLVGSAGYVFNPSTGNTVSIPLPAGSSARYVRLTFAGNTGATGGQVSELQVYGGGATGTATLSANPTSLTFPAQAVNTTSATRSVTIANTGSVAAAISSVTTSGDFTQTTTCGSSLAAGASCAVAVAFRPTGAGTRTGSLTVSSNAGNPTLTVPLSGTGTSPVTNLAAGRPTSESGHSQTYASGNATDGNQATYWESVNNAFPQWLQVDLGSAQPVSRVVLKLPASWGSRAQTLSVSGSTDGTTFPTVKAATSYTFDPATGNTVTITFPTVSIRYLRLTVTANTGWPAGQLSEVEAYSS